MFSRTREPSLLELATDRALRELEKHQMDSPDYAKTLESTIKLHKLKLEEKTFSVSKDTLVVVAANLVGILMILRYEHANVITSRAMNLILKPRG